MAKPKKDKKPAPPPLIRLRGPNGIAVYPLMTQRPDGSWEIANLEELKKWLQMDLTGLK